MEAMGGVKKKSLASMEKSQDSTETAQEQTPAKGKKVKEKGMPQQRKQLSFLAPKMGEADMVKALTPLKAITVYTAARALGVNASVAAGVLRDLESKNMIARVGGFSGHGVWTTKA
jgi:small subunit ribosomal protein S25e